MADTYTVNVECHNCQRDGQVEVPKGTLAPSVSTCPNCGCETANQKLAKPYTVGWPSSYPRRPINWGNDWGTPPSYLSNINAFGHQGNQQ